MKLLYLFSQLKQKWNNYSACPPQSAHHKKREETWISHFRNDASDFVRMRVSQCERAEELFILSLPHVSVSQSVSNSSS